MRTPSMDTPGKPTHADDCERLLRILADAPAEGLSIEEIHEVTKQGETWSFHAINRILCDLRPQVASEKVRAKGGKVTKFSIKRAN